MIVVFLVFKTGSLLLVMGANDNYVIRIFVFLIRHAVVFHLIKVFTDDILLRIWRQLSLETLDLVLQRTYFLLHFRKRFFLHFQKFLVVLRGLKRLMCSVRWKFTFQVIECILIMINSLVVDP